MKSVAGAQDMALATMPQNLRNNGDARFFTLTLQALLLIATAVVAGEANAERVQFPAGSSGDSIEGMISGYDSIHYQLGAQFGQAMTVVLDSDNSSNYFNVYSPGATPGEDAAVFIGSTGGNRFDGRLTASGDYIVQVYLTRNAARRDERAHFTIDFSINNVGSNAASYAVDAKVAGTDFEAAGNIPCAAAADEPMAICPFGVKRGNGFGNAEVWISLPDGNNRVITFEDGAPMSSNAKVDLSAGREAELNSITIGGERYQIPDAVVLGG